MFAQPLELLRNWALNAERHWYAIPGRPDLGCYGAGYNAWGVQTNQKYLAALATLAIRGEGLAGLDRGWALDRALAALRFSLASHVSGDGACTDGTQWGHTWISGLGIERMMHGVYLLWPELAEADRDSVRRVLVSECEWIMASFHRGQIGGVVADVWNSSGKNAPESNLWNGAILWRTAAMFPDHPAAADWQERAHVFLVNSVSVAADATDETILAGKPIRERHVGANFFPNYALDHHGYLNVGYMVICVSNAAMLHFDCKLAGLPRPETLDHHQADLWRLVRRLIFSDGRLARIGGDSRVRYAYCQEYLLPSFLYAADRLGDAHALALADAQLALIAQEAAFNGDGSFYGKRLATMEAHSPYYYTRLESDRACALSQWTVYRSLLAQHASTLSGAPPSFGDAESKGAIHVTTHPSTAATNPVASAQDASGWVNDYEVSVAGLWHEPEHGAIMHRSPTRLASFAWRAFGLTQGMCLPPDDSHLAEWESNLVGQIEFAADPHPAHPKPPPGRRLIGYQSKTFDGGFITCGSLIEGAEVELAEGWTGRDLATHYIAFAALPDGRTVVGLELIRLGKARVLVRSVKGLHLNLPNDFYNGFARTLATEAERSHLGCTRPELVEGRTAHASPSSAGGGVPGPGRIPARLLTLTSPAGRNEVISLGGRWANVDGRLGVIGIYGAETLAVSRSAARRGGAYRSLYVDEICWPCCETPAWADAGATVLDAGWAVLSGADAAAMRGLASDARTRPLALGQPLARGVAVVGADSQTYCVVANFSPAALHIPIMALAEDDEAITDIAARARVAGTGFLIAAGQARIFRKQRK